MIPVVTPEEYIPKVQALQQARMAAATERTQKAGVEYLAKAEKEAGATKTTSGIVVDRHLQTTAPGVYALGDCAEVEGLVLPFIMPITHAARALAATLAGKPTLLTYPPMPVLVKTHACPTIVSPPPIGAAGEWQVTADADGVKSLFVDPAGKLLGYALNGKATAERAKLTAQLPPVLA